MNASVNELCSKRYYNANGRENIAPIQPRTASGSLGGVTATTPTIQGVTQPIVPTEEKKNIFTKIGDFLQSGKAQDVLSQAQTLAGQVASRGGASTGVQGSVGGGASGGSGGSGGDGGKKDGTKGMMYVYLGLVVVAVGVVGYFVFKNK